MSDRNYASPTDVLTDEESVLRQAIDEHARYIEQAYALPEKRALVLALAQFGATPTTIVEFLDVSERMVRQHWTLVHSGGVVPRHHRDVFGTSIPKFGDIGTSERIWPWPWQHAVTVEYDDPDIGASVRKTVYRDVYFHHHGDIDYLVVSETTHQQQGYEKTTYTRQVYPGGEPMARQMSSSAETPWEYEAVAHAIELTKGDANGEVSPEEVLGLSYEDLPTLEGVVSGPNADMAEHFTDTKVTHRPDRIDWESVYAGGPSPYPQFEVHRTDHGLSL